jgi:hypothetical protein
MRVAINPSNLKQIMTTKVPRYINTRARHDYHEAL